MPLPGQESSGVKGYYKQVYVEKMMHVFGFRTSRNPINRELSQQKKAWCQTRLVTRMTFKKSKCNIKSPVDYVPT